MVNAIANFFTLQHLDLLSIVHCVLLVGRRDFLFYCRYMCSILVYNKSAFSALSTMTSTPTKAETPAPQPAPVTAEEEGMKTFDHIIRVILMQNTRCYHSLSYNQRRTHFETCNQKVPHLFLRCTHSHRASRINIIYNHRRCTRSISCRVGIIQSAAEEGGYGLRGRGKASGCVPP